MRMIQMHRMRATRQLGFPGTGRNRGTDRPMDLSELPPPRMSGGSPYASKDDPFAVRVQSLKPETCVYVRFARCAHFATCADRQQRT
jgi:hypothetical protein